MEQSSPTAASRAASTVDAAVIQGDAYPMFAAAAVTLEGALLTGGLLLEIGEEVLLELRLAQPVHVRARVVAIVPGEQTAMQVVWVDLDDATRQRLRGA
ncbi:MAG TPA: hypothetical protein VMZ28_13800 [Kofleriaceae bacterium]|nr:hypothetical protein [Kofleriaceae bacterium]